GNPRRDQPQVDPPDRSRSRLQGPGARPRARRAVPGVGGVPIGNGGRAGAGEGDRRSRDRRGRARPDHARGPAGIRRRPAWSRSAIRGLAGCCESADKGPMSVIELYDTTLRDGMQGEGMSLSAQEKLRVAHRLDELGIDLIEAGFASSNPKELEVFELLSRETFSNSVLAAFGMTRRRDMRAAQDPALRVLAGCFAPVCTLVGKTWALHLDKVVKVDPEENLRMISESVSF